MTIRLFEYLICYSLSNYGSHFVTGIAAGASRSATPCAPPRNFCNKPYQDEILRRLSLRDAVRTSALSRGWRRRWESVPGLALVFPDGTPPGVVDRVLLCHTGGGVSRFAFEVVDGASASHAGHWLLALSRRGVQSIDLRFSLPPLPVGFAGFPVLEDLHLSEVNFLENGEGQVQAIIHGSPLLRVLYLAYLQMIHPVVGCVIEAPNLHSLTLITVYNDGWRFGELPCLHDAWISVTEYTEVEQDFGELLSRVAQVEELTLFSPYNTVKIDMPPFAFYNLKSLDLSTLFDSVNHMLVMFCLLRSSPNLEKLKVKNRGIDYGDAIWEFLSAQWTDGMCANLQDVQITSLYQCLPMPFIKLILSKSSRLRTLSVDERPVSQDDPLNELLTITRASAQAQVLFKDGLEP
ncbi:unnamed protein product [Urochloa decumbens]|uniref:FBD domain-containing protein n=1 Tax=Urochloa decumbens TaxID=240449 RepID=A0ABC9G4X2_9POAL